MPDSARQQDQGVCASLFSCRLTPAAIACLLLLISACDQTPQSPAPNEATPQDRLEPFDPHAQPPGWFELSTSGDHVVIRANSALRSTLLKVLGEKTNLDIYGIESIDGVYTGTINADNPAETIKLIARNTSLSLHLDWRAGAHQLTAVQLGNAARSTAHSDEPSTTDQIDNGTGIPVIPPAGEPVTGLTPNDVELGIWREEFSYARSMLTAADPESRIKALNEFPAEGAGLRVLAEAFGNESDPLVRTELLHKLDESGSLLAKTQTLSALSDPNPRVVATAVQLITEWHDPEVTERYLQPLLQHSDTAIRAAAEAAVDRLRIH